MKRLKILSMIYLVISLIGIISMFVSVTIESNVWSKFFEAVGIGFLVSGIVYILDQLFSEKTKTDGIQMIASTRAAIPDHVYRRKYHAEKVDIGAVSLTGCLTEIVNDSKQTMINRVLFNHTRLRLLFVHPDSPYLKQRAMEDGISEQALRERQRHSVELCVIFMKQLEDRYRTAVEEHDFNPGSVEIKLIDFCPYITIDRADDEIYWGMYTSETVGLNSPMFSVTKDQNYALYDQLKKHFDSLREKNPLGCHNLVTMAGKIGTPDLNRQLADSILGSAKVDRLLQ